MSTKFIGRQFNVGIGKESARGTAVVASYWLPWATVSIDDEIKVAKDETSIGVIEAGVGQEITTFLSKGSIEGRMTDQGLGLLLMATMGTDTVGAVESGVKDHAFTVLQTAQHPSLTFLVVEPNSNSGSGYGYPLGMIDELQLMFELNKYAMYKASFRANKGATKATTTSYTVENAFRPQDGVFKMASALSGLSGASAINIKKLDVTIKKNIEEDTVIGNTSPVDRLNREFMVSGSFELFYSDRTQIDTNMLADLQQAISITFINSAVTIGSTSHPTFTLRLAKTKLESVARKVDLKGIVMQTIKFTAFYSISDSEMIDITLRNTVTSSY